MLDAELAEIVANLWVLGTDIAGLEVKNSHGGLPKSLRETLSAFSNTRGGVVILGLDEGRGFAPVGLPNPAEVAADLGSMCSTEMGPPLRPLIGIHKIATHLYLGDHGRQGTPLEWTSRALTRARRGDARPGSHGNARKAAASATPSMTASGTRPVIASARSSAQLVEIARQGAEVLGAGIPASTRLENIVGFLDLVSEGIARAAEQAREVLYASAEATSGNGGVGE